MGKLLYSVHYSFIIGHSEKCVCIDFLLIFFPPHNFFYIVCENDFWFVFMCVCVGLCLCTRYTNAQIMNHDKFPLNVFFLLFSQYSHIFVGSPGFYFDVCFAYVNVHVCKNTSNSNCRCHIIYIIACSISNHSLFYAFIFSFFLFGICAYKLNFIAKKHLNSKKGPILTMMTIRFLFPSRPKSTR